jgi:hypothetical protein
MAAPRASRVAQVPGEPTLTPTDSTAASEATAAGDPGAESTTDEQPESPEASADLQAVQAKLAAAERELAQLKAQAAAPSPAPAPAPAGDAPRLLRADDVDPEKISNPVLTAQGWVVPAPKPDPRQLR